MITFELTGCGGLQQRTDDGKIITIHKGHIIIAAGGRLLADLNPNNYKSTSLETARTEIFKLYNTFQDGFTGKTFRITSRHPVKYDERKYDYEYRWLEDEKEKIDYLSFDLDPGLVIHGLNKRRITSPTCRADLDEKIIRTVVENTFTLNGTPCFAFA